MRNLAILSIAAWTFGAWTAGAAGSAPATAPAAALHPAMTDAQAREAFESLYDRELKRVAASADRKDDVELAGMLLEAAKTLTKEPALLAILCEKSYELAAVDPSGFETAAGAMKLLATEAPAKRIGALTGLANLRQRQWGMSTPDTRNRNGDELFAAVIALGQAQAETGEHSAAAASFRRAMAINSPRGYFERDNSQAMLEAAMQRERVLRETAVLRGRLAASDVDLAARKQLILLYVAEMNDPAEAAKLLDATVDEATRTYVRLAAGRTEDLAPQAAMELAQWYAELAQKASPPAKPAMLARAKACYDGVLARPGLPELLRTRAQLSMRMVEAEQEKLSDRPGSRVELIPILDLRHDADETWEFVGEKLLLRGGKHTTLTVPVAFDGSYELTISFEVRERSRELRVAVPVGSGRTYLTLPLGAWGESNVLGPFYSSDGTRRLIRQSDAGGRTTIAGPGQVHTLQLTVTLDREKKEAQVFVKLNGADIVSWRGPQAEVMPSRPGQAGPPLVDLSSSRSTVLFHSIKARMLSGRMKLTR